MGAIVKKYDLRVAVRCELAIKKIGMEDIAVFDKTDIDFSEGLMWKLAKTGHVETAVLLVRKP